MKQIDLTGYKFIPGYEGLYSINECGDVYSHTKYKILRPCTHNGYLLVNLHKNKKGKTLPIHRLVAFAYLPKPEGNVEIDHIDTNRKNNHVSNLRWVTRLQNCHNPLTEAHFREAMAKKEHWLRGEPMPNEVRSKISRANTGKKRTEEVRAKLGAIQRERFANPAERLKMKEYAKLIPRGAASVQAKKVGQYDKSGSLIKIWSCISDVRDELGIKPSSISNCLSGLSNTAGGFKWKLYNN